MNSTPDVVTLGESMVLFTPRTNGKMRYAQDFSMKFAGAESNVAIGLVRLGHTAGWISKIGNDEFGEALLAFMRGHGVDVSRALRHPAPTGVFFKEVRRPADVRVYYYRQGSAASHLTAQDLDEAYIGSARFLLVSGITPALSDTCREAVFEALAIARRHNVTIVFDPNLRRKLWSEEDARRTLLAISSMSDIVLAGADEAEFLFGTDDVEQHGQLFLQRGASLAVIKQGANGAQYFTESHNERVPGFPVKQVVDPVGAGDGFTAGFLSGLLDGLSIRQAVERANAVGALVTMFSGDVEGLPERNELAAFMNADEHDVTR